MASFLADLLPGRPQRTVSSVEQKPAAQTVTDDDWVHVSETEWEDVGHTQSTREALSEYQLEKAILQKRPVVTLRLKPDNAVRTVDLERPYITAALLSHWSRTQSTRHMVWPIDLDVCFFDLWYQDCTTGTKDFEASIAKPWEYTLGVGIAAEHLIDTECLWHVDDILREKSERVFYQPQSMFDQKILEIVYANTRVGSRLRKCLARVALCAPTLVGLLSGPAPFLEDVRQMRRKLEAEGDFDHFDASTISQEKRHSSNETKAPPKTPSLNPVSFRAASAHAHFPPSLPQRKPAANPAAPDQTPQPEMRTIPLECPPSAPLWSPSLALWPPKRIPQPVSKQTFTATQAQRRPKGARLQPKTPPYLALDQASSTPQTKHHNNLPSPPHLSGPLTQAFYNTSQFPPNHDPDYIDRAALPKPHEVKLQRPTREPRIPVPVDDLKKTPTRNFAWGEEKPPSPAEFVNLASLMDQSKSSKPATEPATKPAAQAHVQSVVAAMNAAGNPTATALVPGLEGNPAPMPMPNLQRQEDWAMGKGIERAPRRTGTLCTMIL